MIELRPAAARGHVQHGWLDTHHSFSFGEYYDPQNMGFRALRVINDDRIAPGGGFPPHPHRDMEILTWVIEGGLRHQDSMGNSSVIRPGEAQRMSAGRGVVHSEFNASETEALRLLQIWILPERGGLPPGYEEQTYAPAERTDTLRLIAGPAGQVEGAVALHQDAKIYASLLSPEATLSHPLDPARFYWLQMISGALEAGGQRLEEGDALALHQEPLLELVGQSAAEFLLFDLA